MFIQGSERPTHRKACVMILHAGEKLCVFVFDAGFCEPDFPVQSKFTRPRGKEVLPLDPHPRVHTDYLR